MQLSIQTLNVQHNWQDYKFTPLPNLKSYTFKRGTNLRLLITQDVLWHIHSGYVRTLSVDEDGTLTPLGFWGTGDLVGQTLSTLEPYDIECLTEVTVAEVPQNYEVSAAIILSHLHQAQALVRIMHQPRVEDRLLKFLEMLAHRFGRPTHDRLSIDPYLTHEEIAESIGTSRITVTRLMGELKRSGTLRWSSQYRSLSRT